MAQQDPVLYRVEGPIAYLTLNRPARFNAIDEKLPFVLSSLVARANQDSAVRVLVLSGAGDAFCSGYDLQIFAETPGPIPGSQKMPWDPLVDFQFMWSITNSFMSLWRSLKPVICKVHGAGAVAGGSDIALCCDIVLMADAARIGYPPARVWGCPTTAMWVHRLGAERAKRMLLTGDTVSGKEAAQMGLVTASYPADRLDQEVEALARRMSTLPANQLMMQKLVINQAFENQGLASSQVLATFMDGVARHSPEGVAFKKRAEEVGWKRAVQERDSVPQARL
jgi:enoyl-CoA hydratase